MKDLTEKMTPATLKLFLSLMHDSGNWSGEPLFDGGSEDRGNLTHLKKLGVLETFADEGCVFVIWTDLGEKLMAAHGYTKMGRMDG